MHKLIRDPFNGQRWQWKYWGAEKQLWFDYGPAFNKREDAVAYGDKEGIS